MDARLLIYGNTVTETPGIIKSYLDTLEPKREQLGMTGFYREQFGRDFTGIRTKDGGVLMFSQQQGVSVNQLFGRPSTATIIAVRERGARRAPHAPAEDKKYLIQHSPPINTEDFHDGLPTFYFVAGKPLSELLLVDATTAEFVGRQFGTRNQQQSIEHVVRELQSSLR